MVTTSMRQTDRILSGCTLGPSSVTEETVSVEYNFLSTNLRVNSMTPKVLQGQSCLMQSYVGKSVTRLELRPTTTYLSTGTRITSVVTPLSYRLELEVNDCIRVNFSLGIKSNPCVKKLVSVRVV
jgi:hypothetical protein